MKNKTFDRICYGAMACMVAVGIFGIVHGCVRAAEKPDDEQTETAYIVYTDENSHPYAVITNP